MSSIVAWLTAQAAVPVVGWIVAQNVGGSDLNLVTLITQVGFSGIFLWQWLDATKERRNTQVAMSDLFERLLPVLEAATSTLDRVQEGMEKQVEKAEQRSTPSPQDMAYNIRRLEDLVGDLNKSLTRKEG